MNPFPGQRQREYAFPPVVGPGARVLILGSMPGRASLDAQAYYAHPRNAFWPIMAAICGFAPDLPIDARYEALRRKGIALWDVLDSCIRPGSLDSSIDRSSQKVRDFAPLLSQLPDLRLIAFNGATAERLFRRHVWPDHRDRLTTVTMQRLPSTSPAMARLKPDEKLARWAEALLPVLTDGNR